MANVELPEPGPRALPAKSALRKQQIQLEDNLNGQLDAFLKDLKQLAPHFEDLSQYPEVAHLIETWLPAIYQTYDQFVHCEIESLNKKISCHKTCSNCCNHFVASVEPFELIYLDRTLRQKKNYGNLLYQLSLRHKAFDALAQKATMYNEDELLFEYLQKDIACPFLSQDNQCSVYGQRPMPCRMFFSLSAPKLCRGVHTLDPLNKNFLVELSDHTEITISQISLWFQELELPNLFFPGLLKVNEIFGAYE